MSWNIEGFRRNQMNLKHFCDQYNPSLISLSEPQAFQCDIALHTQPFSGEYCFLLNSEETNNPDLAMESPKAHGGTMMMWKVDLDPFITPLPTLSPAFLPVYLKIPGFSPSIHVALYLPTSGKDSEFVSALSQLGLFLEEVAATHQCPVYIRGDANFLFQAQLCIRPVRPS